MMPTKRPVSNVFEAYQCTTTTSKRLKPTLPATPAKDSPTQASTKTCTPPGVPERLGDRPLRVVFVGHNPSDHAWSTGHYYSNPSNWFWRILKGTGIAPDDVEGPKDDWKMAGVGVGLTDVGTGHPGTDSSAFKSNIFIQWRQDFYTRLCTHVQRANQDIGCTCGHCGEPMIVAFAGKRQLQELFLVDVPKRLVPPLEVGRLDAKPPKWPLMHSELWLLPSTSGAAALSREARWAPFEQLAQRLAEVGEHPGRRCWDEGVVSA